MRPIGSPDALQRRRERAIELLKEGHTLATVARKMRVDIRSVQRWKRTFQIKGLAGIHAQTSSGRPPRLSEKNKESLT